MKVASLEAIFRAFNESKARYLVVGGVAVIAHGYVRLRGDEGLSLIIDPLPQTHRHALDALQRLQSIMDVPITVIPMEAMMFDIQYAAGIWKEVSADIKIRVPSVMALIALMSGGQALDRIDSEALHKLHLNPKVQHSPDYWPCDWESHELQQLRRGANRSFRENLIMLEEMMEFAEKSAKAPWIKQPGFPKVLSSQE